MGVRFCENCGAAVPDGADKCQNCGYVRRHEVTDKEINNRYNQAARHCRRCGGPMVIQSNPVPKGVGAGTVLLYLFIAFILALCGIPMWITLLFFLIISLLRKKNVIHTVATCQYCGMREEISKY